MNFSWGKGVGLGILLWLVMFAVVSFFVGFELYGNGWVQLATIIIAGGLAYSLAYYAEPRSALQALGYGALWTIIGLLLDTAITLQFAPEIFSSWNLWVGYLLILTAPMLQERTTHTAASLPR